MFLLDTGARCGEAWALRWSDLDFAREQIRLVTTKRAARGRTAEPRWIPTNEALQDLLSGLERTGERVLRRKEALKGFQWVCRRAGIKGRVRLHDLRHTFASHLAIKGTPLPAIMELLGHSKMDMTLRYAHLCPSVKTEAVGGLNFGAKRKSAQIVAVGEPKGAGRSAHFGHTHGRNLRIANLYGDLAH